MYPLVKITRALSDPSRLRMLMALVNGELCVCQLTEFSGLATSTVSKHMSILREAGLVESRKDSRWVYYHLPGDSASPLIRSTIQFVREQLQAEPQIAEDSTRIAELIEKYSGTLCQPEVIPCVTCAGDAEVETA